MKRYTYWRNAIICELYEVEAESEEQAVEQLRDGLHDPVSEEWVDWASGGYELENIEELDPLYCMVRNYGETVCNQN
jgi:hypothetical protein